MDISIIIVNYKSECHLTLCLSSLLEHLSGVSYEIIIVNNDSAPIENILPTENITIIKNITNEGFAKACNKGAAIAKGKNLFFLNPDTEIKAGNISDLISILNNDSSIGIIAPKLLVSSGEIQQWSSGYATNLWDIIKNNLGFIKSKNLWDANRPIHPDWVSGAAFAIKKDVFENVSGFDESFFMYFEDADLCKRVTALDKKILVTPTVKILHTGGQSALDNNKQKEQYYLSQDYYFKKNLGLFQSLLLILLRKFSLFFKIIDKKNIFYCLLLFCVLLPFQFALNPTKGVDLAIIRIIIPLMFSYLVILRLKNKEKIFTANKSVLIPPGQALDPLGFRGKPRGIKPFGIVAHSKMLACWRIISLVSLDNKITYLLLLFLFLAILSISFSQNYYWSLRKLLFLFSIFPVYFLATAFLNSFYKQYLIVYALVIGSTVLAWVAIIQFTSQFIFSIDTVYIFLAKYITPIFLGNTFSASVAAYPSWLVNSGGTTYMRAIAVFPDPHMLSYYFGMIIPWSIALWAKSISHKKWLALAVVSLIFADILTFTRGGYLALIAGSLIILPLVSIKTAKKIISGTIIIFFLFLIAPHNPVAGRLTSSFDVQEGSNQARLGNWQQAVAIISSHPFGVGIGSYSLSVKPTATYREPIYAHNLYLDIAAELGVPAVLVFIALLIFVFNYFWKISKTQPFFIAGVSSITVFSIHSLVENPMYSVHILPLFLIIIALGASTHLYEKNINIK